jgi:hypothetical protein
MVILIKDEFYVHKKNLLKKINSVIKHTWVLGLLLLSSSISVLMI